MILDSRHGLRGMFYRTENGQAVRWVRWYDTETQEYEAFRMDPDEARTMGLDPRRLLYRGKASLRFEPAVPLKTAGRIAPSTPLDEIRREVLRDRVFPVIQVPGLRIECDEPKCHRLAEWRVGDEQLVEPERDAAGKLHERAVCVGVRSYCSWHFRLPTTTSERGITCEVEVSTRPQ